MGFLSGVLGTDNDFQAHAPINKFKANSPVYASTIGAANAQATGGAGPASGTIDRQNALNDSLTAAANGQGPSPAQEMLRQATSQNINTAAGQVASARGINPALAARMAVDSAGSANQNSAGQAATLKANEQIAARAQLGQNLSSTGQTQIGQQQAGVAALGTAGNLDLGAEGLDQRTAAQNAALDLGAQQINAGVASQNASTAAGIVGGVLNGIGGAAGTFASAAPAMAAAHGGEVPEPQGSGPVFDYLSGLHKPQRLEGGGMAGFDPEAAEGIPDTGSALIVNSTPIAAPPASPNKAGKAGGDFISAIGGGFTAAGQAGTAAFDRFTARPVAGSMYATGGSIHQDPSGMVPGRAAVPGDAPRNDTVHTLLSPGEIVIPRSITQGPNAPAKAASFVASILKRGGATPFGAPPIAPKAPAKASSAPTSTKSEKPATGRGSGRNETRRRIKKSDKPAAANE